jgi:hypothetical protein
MRTLSSNYTRSLFARMTNKGGIALLHVSWIDPTSGVLQHLRLSRWGVDVVSNGQTYFKRDYDVLLPGDDNSDPEMTLVIENVDGQIMNSIGFLSTVPQFELFWVSSDTPNIEEFGFTGKLRLISHVDFADVLEAKIEIDPPLSVEPYPAQRFRVADGFLTIR